MLAVSQRTLLCALALVMALLALAIPANANRPMLGAYTPGDPYSGTTHGH